MSEVEGRETTVECEQGEHASCTHPSCPAVQAEAGRETTGANPCGSIEMCAACFCGGPGTSGRETTPVWGPGARQVIDSIDALDTAWAEFQLVKQQGGDDRTALALALNAVGFALEHGFAVPPPARAATPDVHA